MRFTTTSCTTLHTHPSVSIDEWLFDTADPQNVVYYIIKVREFFTASDYLEWVVYRRYRCVFTRVCVCVCSCTFEIYCGIAA
jgi:hypothetical protein